MLVRTHVPLGPLSALVESFTLVVAPEYPYEREKLLPDGGLDLLINLGPHPHAAVLPDEQRTRTYRSAWVSGTRRSPLILERARHGYHLIHVRFRMGGATAFFDFHIAEVTDRVVELDEIWDGSRVEELRERLVGCERPEDKFAVLERWLEVQRVGEGPPPLIAGALRLMRESDLGMGMREMAARLGTSHTRLIQSFGRSLGLKPKSLQRILRFQRAVQLEDVQPRLHWTAIAHRCGYHDQAHLIREFHLFARMSPTAYRAGRGEYPNYVPVA